MRLWREKGKPIRVIWQDAVNACHQWELAGEWDYDQALAASLHHTTGHFITIRGGTLFLAQNYRPADGMMSNVMAIPIDLVREVREIGREQPIRRISRRVKRTR